MRASALLLAVAGCLLAAGVAQADQCQWINETQAAKAQAILAEGPMVVKFCEPCKEEGPGKAFLPDSVEVKTPEGNFREISINGKAVDLAYTFVRTGPGRYENLALLAGCEASGVSVSLTIIESSAELPPAAEEAGDTAVAATEIAVEEPVTMETAAVAAAEPVKAETAAKDAAAAPASGLTAKFSPGTRGPVGAVYFFRTGRKVENATLRVFDVHGNLIKRVNINDSGRGQPATRRVGSWDLTNLTNRTVRTGTYSVQGTVATRGGASEEVSLTIDVK